MIKFKSITLIALAGIFLQSCSNDDDSVKNDPENGNYSKGIFILNEGKFQAGNADITYYDPSTVVGDKNPVQEIFKKANSRNLGDVAQNMVIKGNKAYVVVNNSNKVEIVDNTNFKSIATVTDNILNPRYIVTDNKYFYVSNWGDSQNPNDDYVAIYNLSDNKFVKKISVSEGPGHIIVDNNKLYVAYEASGRNGIFGKSVDAIDLDTSIKTNYPVGDSPTDMVKVGSNLFVLSQGIIDWNGGVNTIGGALTRINLTNNVSTTMPFDKTEHPDFLIEDQGYLYYSLNKDIYKMSINAASLPTTRLFKSTAIYIYGLEVKNNSIYVLDAKDFASAGSLLIYNAAGALQNEITTGIGPNSVYIK